MDSGPGSLILKAEPEVRDVEAAQLTHYVSNGTTPALPNPTHCREWGILLTSTLVLGPPVLYHLCPVLSPDRTVLA